VLLVTHFSLAQAELASLKYTQETEIALAFFVQFASHNVGAFASRQNQQ
jgi:hypothetical protein